MKTGEAIEWLGRLKKIHDRGIFNIEQNANEIIELLQDNEYLGRILMCPKDFYKRSEYIDKLQRGEKFEAMCGELEKYLREKELMRIVGKMHSIKRKHFPRDKPHFYECSSKDPRLKKVYFKEADNEIKMVKSTE